MCAGNSYKQLAFFAHNATKMLVVILFFTCGLKSRHNSTLWKVKKKYSFNFNEFSSEKTHYNPTIALCETNIIKHFLHLAFSPYLVEVIFIFKKICQG